MGRRPPPFLVVGHLNKVHGTKGEIFVWPLTDAPEETFAPGAEFALADGSGNAPDPALPSLQIESVRPYRRGFLAKFADVENRTKAGLFKGRYLLRPFDEESRGEEELYYHEMLGMRVESLAGEVIGEVREVYELNPAHLLEVEGLRGSLHIPFTREMVKSVDRGGDRIVVDLPDGFLDL